MYKVDAEANDVMIILQKQMLESDPLKNPQDIDNALDEWFRRHPEKPNNSQVKEKNAVR